MGMSFLIYVHFFRNNQGVKQGLRIKFSPDNGLLVWSMNRIVKTDIVFVMKERVMLTTVSFDVQSVSKMLGQASRVGFFFF